MSNQRSYHNEHKCRAYGQRASDASPGMALPYVHLIRGLMNHGLVAPNRCPIARTSCSAALNVDRVMFRLLSGTPPHATQHVALGMEAWSRLPAPGRRLTAIRSARAFARRRGRRAHDASSRSAQI